MLVFGKKRLYLGKSGCIYGEWIYYCKVVVFGQKFLYSGHSGCIRAKVVVFKKKWLYSGNVAVFVQN